MISCFQIYGYFFSNKTLAITKKVTQKFKIIKTSMNMSMMEIFPFRF